VGAACGAKPTALLIAGPLVGVVLLGSLPVRQWPVVVAAGVGVGLAMLAPWLFRNWVQAGNPVFPYGSEWFGSAHWSSEQVARYMAAHRFEGSWGERLAMLVAPDASDPMGRVHRGMLHPQWFAFFPMAVVGGIAGLASRGTRRMTAVVAIGFVLQVAAWLVFTHVQSRFLLPLAISGAMLMGLGMAAAAGCARRLPEPLRMGVVGAVAVVAVLLQFGASMEVFRAQGQPNRFLTFGPRLFSGELFRERAADAGAGADPEPFEHVWSQLYVNFSISATARVYLLGDARPLYFTVPVLYNTTWDAWPLAEAMRRAPEDPLAWLTELRGRGVTHVLVNYAEIERLGRSGDGGWTDPLITAAGVARLMEGNARRVRSWPETGRQWPEAAEVLYELRGRGAPRP
jgi:hypothetical protein